MKFILLLAFFTTACLSAKENVDEKVNKVSEYLGYMYGRELEMMNLSFNAEGVARGLKNYEVGVPCPLETENFYELILQIFDELFEQKALENKKKAEEFLQKLEANASITKIIDKKLYIEIIKEGSGKELRDENTDPLIRYSASTLEGISLTGAFELVDSVHLPLNSAIPGFVLGVLGMKEGGKRRIYVHPDLGYKRGGTVPPNSLLIFDVEINEVK